jgi:nitrite reductase (NADH) small subunit
MSKHKTVGSIDDIPKGEGRAFALGGGHCVAVFHARDGRVFATQPQCPHRGGPLADGLLGGTTLVCPLHEWSFDLLSGMALNGGSGIRTYPVTQRPDGTLVVEIEEDGEQPPWRITDYTKA